MAQKETHKLSVQSRTVVGRKVKKLRKEGILPGNIYGKQIKSHSIQLDLKAFLPVYKEVGETGLIELKVDKEEKTRPVLIHNLQVNPVSDLPINVDFYQVDLKQAITANIPVELVGVAPATTQNLGILIQPTNEIEVEALPADLPEKFEVDVTKLAEVGQTIKVSDLKAKAGVKIITDPEQLLAKIDPLAEEIVAPAPVVEEGAAEGEAPAEGEKPVDGVAPAEGEKPAEKPAEKEAKKE